MLEQFQCGIVSKGHRAMLGAVGGLGSVGLCPRALNKPASLS